MLIVRPLIIDYDFYYQGRPTQVVSLAKFKKIMNHFLLKFVEKNAQNVEDFVIFVRI
jgi:hypothetical protein